MNSSIGSKIWVYPDGYLPGGVDDDLGASGQAVCILNPNEKEAKVKISIYYNNKESLQSCTIASNPKTVKHYRLDDPNALPGITVPEQNPFGVVLKSDNPIVAQMTLVDTRGSNLGWFSTIGYNE